MTSKLLRRCNRTLDYSYLRALCGATLFTVVLSGSLAHADLVVPPPPDCVDKPDGTFCKLPDGTAGKCVTTQDTRRPGRTNQHCEKDSAECDRLEIGAECHGYLGKPAHCKEFSDPEKHTTWRTCQVDAHNADAPKLDTTATPSTVREDTVVTQKESPAPAKLSCSAVPGAASATGAAPLALGFVAAALRLRRRRRS